MAEELEVLLVAPGVGLEVAPGVGLLVAPPSGTPGPIAQPILFDVYEVVPGTVELYWTAPGASQVELLQGGQVVGATVSGYTLTIVGLAVDTPYVFGLLATYADGSTQQSRQIAYGYGSNEFMYVDPDLTPILKALEAMAV